MWITEDSDMPFIVVVTKLWNILWLKFIFLLLLGVLTCFTLTGSGYETKENIL